MHGTRDHAIMYLLKHNHGNEDMTYKQLQTELERAWELLLTATGDSDIAHFSQVIRELEAAQESLPIDQQH